MEHDERDLVYCLYCDNWPSDCRCDVKYPEDRNDPQAHDEPEVGEHQ